MLYRTSTQRGCFPLKILLSTMMWMVVFSLSSNLSCRAELVDRIAAIVNDDIILLSDLEQAMATYNHMLRKEGYSDAQVKKILADQQADILEQLINEKLIEQQAAQNGIKIKSDEVDANIDRFMRVKGLTSEDLDRYLQMEGLTQESFRGQVRDQLLQQRLMNIEVRSKIVVTDDDVQAYYEENKEQYQGKTNYHLRHILMKVTTPSESERERVYQQMEQLHQRLEAGESFSDLAKVYSQSPTAEDGGDLGFFEIRHLAEIIRKALVKIKPGQFTPVLDTEQGYQIFYIEEILGTKTKTMDMVKAEIQEKLFSEMLNEKLKAWRQNLRQKAHIQILE